jgi:hypothetical protein
VAADGEGAVRDVTHARGRPAGYRPYLDGVRTLAVYLFIAFHTGLGLFTGGFIGVDVFFVLSGLLVTSILMRDLAGSGRVRWRRFYSQRVRRILPAAIVTETARIRPTRSRRRSSSSTDDSRSSPSNQSTWTASQCPRWPICDAVVHNIIVKRDAVHLTATYAESTWMKVDAVFRKQHLVQAATASAG